MIPTEDELRCRNTVLEWFEPFSTRILPGIVRRIAGWKNIPIGEVPDLLLELRQELSVDCLEHAALLVTMTPAARHVRWMRLAERWVYRNRVIVSRRRASELDQEPTHCLPADPATDLPVTDDVVCLGNGRCNFAASAQRTGRGVHAVRKEIEDLANEASGGPERLHFWQQRLGEALTGLAADLLRDRDRVHLLSRNRARPDPIGRMRRLRRLSTRFLVRPATLQVRRILGQWVRRPQLDDGAPRRLLEHATELCPEHSSAWLWLFEARLAEGDCRGAAHAMLRCRTCQRPPRSGLLLARARLLEVRGHHDRAIALLRRARQRWPSDERLRLAAATVDLGDKPDGAAG